MQKFHPPENLENSPEASPTLPLYHLDTLWLQVTGTLCNLACLHCFISCGPKNKTHLFMERQRITQLLDESIKLGVKEIYFTGGEPFLHPEIQDLILDALEVAPLSILTNGTLIDDPMAAWLGATFRASRTSLDIRVSLDGLNAKQNDPIRGRGSFNKIVAGIQRLASHGINPVITVTECCDETAHLGAHQAFRQMLTDMGLTKPRLKFLAPFKIGREARRSGGYTPNEILRNSNVDDDALQRLQCTRCRMVTSQGVFPCPILINDPFARMADELADSLKPIQLDRPACYTCYVEGISCRT